MPRRVASLTSFAAGLLLLPIAWAAPRPLPPEAESLSVRNFAKVQRYLTPKAEELVWERVPWRPALWAAVTEAQKRDRPILLWTMNGHPLGCT